MGVDQETSNFLRIQNHLEHEGTRVITSQKLSAPLLRGSHLMPCHPRTAYDTPLNKLGAFILSSFSSIQRKQF